MFDEGIIRPSTGPWASQIHLVPKKCGDLRFCVDYRKFNSVTIKDSYPLPLIQDIFDQLEGESVFSTLHLKGGYWQINVKESDIPKTAFLCHKGMYEFVRMPFGLCNAPAIFQRVMEAVLHDLIAVACFVYLDDVVIFGKTPAEHQHTIYVWCFNAFNNIIWRWNFPNVNSQEAQLSYWDIISGQGIAPNPSKVDAIKRLPPPSKLSEIHIFLGMAGYYRQVIPRYMTLAYLLVRLKKKNEIWIWSNECRTAFDSIRQHLTSEKALAYPQTDRPYKLYTDASDYAIGAIIVREDYNGIEV